MLGFSRLNRRFSRWLTALALMIWGSSVTAQAADQVRIDAAAQLFVTGNDVPGLAIGFVTPDTSHVSFYGVASRNTGEKVDEQTLFELGSVSKTFTVALAAYAAETGALRWDEPASELIPELKGSHLDAVSLLNLATHTTGGMPLQLPDDVRTDADLTAYYRSWTPAAAPGSVRTYSNPSIGLLGIATARALHGNFADLMRDRVLTPLGLTHTFYHVPPPWQAHYAEGTTRGGRPIRLAGAPLAAEAYGVRTTAGDLLRFLQAQLGLIETSPLLRRALLDTHTGYFKAGPMTQGLIWEWYRLPVSAADFAAGNSDDMALKPQPVTRLDPPQPPPDDALVTKTGATNGFGAYLAFIPGRRIGLVLLANRNTPTAARLKLAEEVLAALGVAGVAEALTETGR